MSKQPTTPAERELTVNQLASLQSAIGTMWSLDELRGPERYASLVKRRRIAVFVLIQMGLPKRAIARVLNRDRSSIKNLLTKKGWG